MFQGVEKINNFADSRILQKMLTVRNNGCEHFNFFKNHLNFMVKYSESFFKAFLFFRYSAIVSIVTNDNDDKNAKCFGTSEKKEVNKGA